MRKTVLSAAAALALVAAAPPASASRDATSEEKKAVSVQALDGTRGLYFMLRISTVDGTWARADSTDIGIAGVARGEAVALHLQDGSWAAVGIVSEDGSDDCASLGMPANVGQDLTLCTPAPPRPPAPRRATAREAREIARAARAPVRCLRVSISRANVGWATWRLRATSGACRPAARRAVSTDAVVFVRRSSGRWRRRGSTSQCLRPADVPRAVYHDLMGCEKFNDDGSPKQ